MEVEQKDISALGVKLCVNDCEKEVGRAYLYILHNDLHKEPFGFLEDVFVEEAYRGQGLGTKILTALIDEAKRRGCYKLVGTSRHARPKVHELYKSLGFKDQGREFRLDLAGDNG
ncbi:GNAT family N-acetyltransferase [Candidatus Woesearchaeota archaeon]|nr:GNAT family N-acetyltransferase [Candidatus Woesearchaeota archaeon]